MIKNKTLSLLFILLIYVIAFAIGFFSSFWIENIFLRFFFIDVIATIVVYLYSAILKNSSVYDPYWSFTPWLFLLYFFIVYKRFDLPGIALFCAITLYSWRLTINWITTFTSLEKEDWRYANYRANNKGFMFFLINFFGIHMMPTILVYGALLPLLYAFVNGLSNYMLLGAGIILVGVILEFFADHSMHKFLKETKERKVCEKGLWKYSRHPNYLGEILVWVGCFVAMAVTHYDKWYLVYGCVLIILLFEFISIPMMEKRQMARRPDYLRYKKETSRLLILPKRKIKDK